MGGRSWQLFKHGPAPEHLRIRVEGPYGELSLRWLSKYPTMM